jgi:hypothetical protein
MGEHFDRKPRRLVEDVYNQSRDYYVAAGWAVKRYLEAHDC